MRDRLKIDDNIFLFINPPPAGFFMFNLKRASGGFCFIKVSTAVFFVSY